MSRRPFPPSIVLLTTGLLACGGLPPPAPLPPTPAPALDAVVGGGYVLACWGNQTLSAYRTWRRDDWRFPVGAAPQLVASVGERAPTACDAARTTVSPQSPIELPDVGAVAPGPGGLEIRREGHLVFARPISGPIVDATYNVATGEIAALGTEGVSRWRPGKGEPQRSPLPPALSGRAFTTLFWTGPWLWLRDAAGQGVPTVLGVDGLHVSGEPQPIPRADPGVRTLVRGGAAVVSVGAEGLRLVDEAGIMTQMLPVVPVEALIPLDGGARLLLAAGGALIVYRIGDAAPHPTAVEEARYDMGGRTARLFDLGDRVVAVGAYGFVTLPRVIDMPAIDTPPGLRPTGTVIDTPPGLRPTGPPQGAAQ